jgi:predicted pyridoxine 5'-phosphate oxidase superfamily flavin-nucleotide-binding protein
MDATEQKHPSDVFFTEAVKAVQTRRGSRTAYARKEANDGFGRTITPDLAEWLAGRDSFYLATASADGQPYIQHRGGPPGFIRVLDEHTLAFADYRGNRQYITLGNLAENDHAMIFLMDYENQSRIKIWGHARVVEDDPALLEKLMPEGYQAMPEQVIVFTVDVWDSNCPQHIPQKLDVADVRTVVGQLQEKLASLETEVAALRAGVRGCGGAGVRG